MAVTLALGTLSREQITGIKKQGQKKTLSTRLRVLARSVADYLVLVNLFHLRTDNHLAAGRTVVLHVSVNINLKI